LYEASLRKYHTRYNQQSTADKWYKEVIKTANELRGYTLAQGQDIYRDMFLQKNPNTDETILAVNLSAELQVYSERSRKTISPTYSNRPALTRRFILTYLNADGTRFTDDANYRTKTFVEEMQHRDPRLGATIRMPGYMRTENGKLVAAPPNLTQTFTGYQIIKGCSDERFPYDDESRDENAHLIYRWAEVLLNKAEALVETGQMTQVEWVNTIGALRARAGITGATLTELPTVADPYMVSFYNNQFTDPVMLEVMRERAVEMIMEGLRPDDLIRWHVAELFADAPMNGMYIPALGEYDFNGDGQSDACFYQGDEPESSATALINVSQPLRDGQRVLSDGDHGEILYTAGEREWQDNKYLYPVPQNDLVRNPKLGQNPGW
jgi:hypothetical protein